jgi:hypothetical protein
LGLGDLTASIDRGSDAYSVQAFSVQTGQGDVAPVPSFQDADDEAGVALSWQHTSGRLSFDTTGRLMGATLEGTNDTQSLSFFQEQATYKPSSTSELDLAGSMNAGDSARYRNFSGGNGRIGYSHTIEPGIAVRASYGTSLVVPPLDTLLSSSSISSLERANGYDAGVEWRLHGETTTLSADVYRNSTQGVYMFNATRWINGPPMVESGAELTLQQFKRVGLGFITAISLPRTYGSGTLPNGFSAIGNLGSMPGASDVAPFRIPYAQGYGEISYKWPRGSRASIGASYIGSNNAYDDDGAFVVVNSNLELSLGARAKLQFSVENLSNDVSHPVPVAPGMPYGYGVPPRTFRFMVRQSFGTGSLYEH